MTSNQQDHEKNDDLIHNGIYYDADRKQWIVITTYPNTLGSRIIGWYDNYDQACEMHDRVIIAQYLIFYSDCTVRDPPQCEGTVLRIARHFGVEDLVFDPSKRLYICEPRAYGLYYSSLNYSQGLVSQGVVWCPIMNLWRVRIILDNENKLLGFFSDRQSAWRQHDIAILRSFVQYEIPKLPVIFKEQVQNYCDSFVESITKVSKSSKLEWDIYVNKWRVHVGHGQYLFSNHDDVDVEFWPLDHITNLNIQCIRPECKQISLLPQGKLCGFHYAEFLNYVSMRMQRKAVMKATCAYPYCNFPRLHFGACFYHYQILPPHVTVRKSHFKLDLNNVCERFGCGRFRSLPSSLCLHHTRLRKMKQRRIDQVAMA